MTDLPLNIYYLPQRRFDAIPGAPWVYWLSGGLRTPFENNRALGDIADIGQGMTTADNERFLRFWWELHLTMILFGCTDRSTAQAGHLRWFPYMKGGGNLKWYGHQDFLINWLEDGAEIKSTGRATIRNSHRYFQPGITWSSLGSKGFSARVMPIGFLFDDKGSSCGIEERLARSILGLLNSKVISYALGLLNPSLSFQSGDIARLPVPAVTSASRIDEMVLHATFIAVIRSVEHEASYDFRVPPNWDAGISDQATAMARLADLETQINDEVYRLYAISDADRAAIEAELAGGVVESEDEAGRKAMTEEEEGGEETEGVISQEELAVRWIGYAVGVVLGRFEVGGQPSEVGGRKPIGCAVYRRDDFAIGSLPEPDDEEFDQLVGMPERFAYIDAQGGRHVFPAEVEQALAGLALPDGIAVFDEGHPRDLPTLVEKALRLMLDPPILNRQSPIVNPTDEVIAAGANGDLRKFLERDYFTKWHLKWYRKRPVYWWLQSPRRGYGFVLFHEKVGKYTLYALLRDYLDHKLNGLRLQVEDLESRRAGLYGRPLRQVESEAETVRKLLAEVKEFAQTVDRIAKGGYEPEANWVDDGVILRLAPLWELIPSWKSEPKKYWERLAAGDFDWSHIAMKYWPQRVRGKCKTNKSFAIAHGHEEWYEGG